MDRKFCILLYSNHSKASLDVLNYIKNIPIDFLTITGMTMICIDNPEFKLILHNNGITHVPTLLVEYYSGSKQKFERDYIYMWIDQIITRNLSKSEYDPAVTAQPNEQNTLRVNKTPIFNINHNENINSVSTGKSQGSQSSSDSIVQSTPLQQDLYGSNPKEVQLKTDATIPMNKKPDIAAIALEMQKNRDVELAEIKEYQKPI
ncbi:MAG: hypothetical protein ACRCZ0_04095 [Cetobacterium sp.]